jgi:hypothetical protein
MSAILGSANRSENVFRSHITLRLMPSSLADWNLVWHLRQGWFVYYEDREVFLHRS